MCLMFTLFLESSNGCLSVCTCAADLAVAARGFGLCNDRDRFRHKWVMPGRYGVLSPRSLTSVIMTLSDLVIK